MTNAELLLRFFAHLWWLWTMIIGLMLWEYKRGGDLMEGRKCPKCGLERYSAYAGPWKCERCGSVVTSKDNIEKAPAKEQEQEK